MSTSIMQIGLSESVLFCWLACFVLLFIKTCAVPSFLISKKKEKFYHYLLLSDGGYRDTQDSEPTLKFQIICKIKWKPWKSFTKLDEFSVCWHSTIDGRIGLSIRGIWER